MRVVRGILAVSLVAVVSGCASMPGGASVEDEVLATMAKYVEAMKANDVDGLVAFFSEDWENDEGATKDVLEGYFQGLADQGLNEDTEVILDETKVVMEGKVATMGPVVYKSSQDETAWEYEMVKEADGVWRCVYSVQL